MLSTSPPPPLPSMLVPSLTVSDGDDTHAFSVQPPSSHHSHGIQAHHHDQPLHGSFLASSANTEQQERSSLRRKTVWRPKVTIGSRVVIGDPQVGDSEDCMQLSVGGLGSVANHSSSISSHRVVCEVVRCPNPRQVVVRSVHPLIVRRGRGVGGGLGGLGTDDQSPRTSRAHSSASSLGGGPAGAGKTASDIDSCGDAALHHVHTMAPSPPPPQQPRVRIGGQPQSNVESFSPTDLSSPLGGSAIVRPPSTPPPLLPIIDPEEGEVDPSSSSSTNPQHVRTTSSSTPPPNSGLHQSSHLSTAPSLFPSSSTLTSTESVTVQHTVPGHRVHTVLEYLLRQIGVLPVVQRKMEERDYSTVVVIIEQASERIATTHLGELLTDPAEAMAAVRLFQSMLLLCGEDPSVTRTTSTTYASKLRPELAILHAFRGQLLCSLRRFDEALTAASTALVLDPLCPESYHVAVKALYAQDRIEDASLVVNVASSTLAALSPEFRALVTAVRASSFMSGALRNQHGLSVIPVSSEEILRTIRLQSQAVNKMCLTVTDRTALSLHAVEDSWQLAAAPTQASSTAAGGGRAAAMAAAAPAAATPAAFRLFPHKTLRCIATKDFSASFLTVAEQRYCATARGNPLGGSVSIPSVGRSVWGAADGDGERVLIENAAVLVPLTAVLPSDVRQKIKHTRLACGYCGWLLTSKSDVLAAARLVHPGLEKRVRDHYPCRTPVSCEGNGCTEVYCSEVCRVRAFVAYHELECDGRESSTWKPVPVSSSTSADFFSSTDGALRWANNKMAAMEAAAMKQSAGADASPLLVGTYSPRRRVSDVVFTTSPTNDAADNKSTSPMSGGGGGGANNSNHSSTSNKDGARVMMREGSEEFTATQSAAFVPGLEESLPRRWSLAYAGLSTNSGGQGGAAAPPQAVSPDGSGSTGKEMSLPFGASSPTPTFSPHLSYNANPRGSVTSELSSQAPSPHRPRQSKGQAMFSARFQAARRSSTTVRGSADVVASLRTSIKRAYHDITDGEMRDAPTHVRTAAAVFVRCITTLLSLFFPASVAWDGGQRVQRQQRGGFHTKEHQERKSNVLRAAIQACEARGVTHAGDRSTADKRDPHSLAVAEEIFRRLGIPFTSLERSCRGVLASTLPSIPLSAGAAAVPTIKRDSLLAPVAPSLPNSSGGSRRNSKSATAGGHHNAAHKQHKDTSASDALHHMWAFVHSTSSVIKLRCSDTAVAMTAVCSNNASASISGQPSGPPSPRGGGGSGSGPNSIFYASPTPMSPFQSHRRVSAVWTLEDDAADNVSSNNNTNNALLLNSQTGTNTMSVLQHLTFKEEPNIWTVGRLLSFLEHPIFTEIMWDMCLTSHSVVPFCGPAAAVGPHVPSHLVNSWSTVARSFQVGVVVLSRTLSLVTDWQRGATHDVACGFDATASGSTSAHKQHPHQSDGQLGASGSRVGSHIHHHHNHRDVHVQSRFAAAPQSRSLSMVGSAADLRASRGLLSLSSQGSRSSSSDSDDEDEDDRRDLTPSEVVEDEGHSEDAVAVGGMMQGTQWDMNLLSQRDTGGNIAVDPSDAAMCCPGERRIVLRGICPIRSRDTLRLVMQSDAVDAFLSDFLDDPHSFRCSTTQLNFPM